MDTQYEARFWSHVQRGKPDECWPWLGYVNPNGYGRFRVGSRKDGSRKLPYAHRIAYELVVGPIPADLNLDHLCRNHPCVNPAHLEPVTQIENLLRGKTNAAKTHCKHGHPFDEANTIRTPLQRQCRACNNAGRRKKRGAAKATREDTCIHRVPPTSFCKSCDQ